MKRLYGLYERERGTKKWQRISDGFYPLDSARRLFQNKLLEPYLNPAFAGNVERRLRPVERAKGN